MIDLGEAMLELLIILVYWKITSAVQAGKNIF